MADTENPGAGGTGAVSAGVIQSLVGTNDNGLPQPDFLIRLRPDADRHPDRALRKALKYLGRSCGLRAVSIDQVPR